MGLSKIPLVTFLVACLMTFGVITRYKIDRKAFLATYSSAGITCLLLTIQNINSRFVTLSKSVILVMEIATYIFSILTIILILYCAITNKERQPPGKLPKL